jgi:hypothetical protein
MTIALPSPSFLRERWRHLTCGDVLLKFGQSEGCASCGGGSDSCSFGYAGWRCSQPLLLEVILDFAL